MEDCPTTSNTLFNGQNFCSTLPNDEDKQEYPLRFIIGCMIFSNGDSDRPLEMCKDFLLDFLRDQLRMLLRKAHEIAIARSRSSIGYTEVVFAFRRHPALVRRLIAYMQLVDAMPNSSKLLQPGDPDEFDLPTSSFSSNAKGTNSQSLINAIREFDMMGHLLAGLDDLNATDGTKTERMRRVATRTSRMDAELYERFSEARQTSFCSQRGRRKPDWMSKFVQWIGVTGGMGVEPGAVNVLNFCAKEIVAILVESAVLCRQQEQRLSVDANDDEQINKALQLRHYEDALRRNRGHAMRGDLLFGYF